MLTAISANAHLHMRHEEQLIDGVNGSVSDFSSMKFLAGYGHRSKYRPKHLQDQARDGNSAEVWHAPLFMLVDAVSNAVGANIAAKKQGSGRLAGKIAPAEKASSDMAVGSPGS